VFVRAVVRALPNYHDPGRHCALSGDHCSHGGRVGHWAVRGGRSAQARTTVTPAATVSWQRARAAESRDGRRSAWSITLLL